MSEDFHIDLTEVEDTGGSFEPIPEGTYELITECKVKTTQTVWFGKTLPSLARIQRLVSAD